MREQGVQKPNPRKQILTDLLALIREKRLEGYKPILMMDANGDDNYEDDIDQDLKQFIEDAHLADHFHEKFPEPSRTYTRGKKRLDRILFDSALVGAIECIGYLGTHEGQFSDHVYAYVDFNEKKLFRGEINRPVDLHSREFRIEQTDKMVAFQKELEKSLKANTVKERVFKLAKSFAQRGKTKRNVRAYQKLDAQIRELAKGAASKVGRKKFGYMRNPDMTLCGRMLIIYKMILDCRCRNAPPTPALERGAAKLNVDLSQFDTMRHTSLRKEVCKRRAALWKSQKGCEAGRAEWLKTEAKERAAAAGDKDWEKRVDEMARVAESRAINRKLGAITKGRFSQALDRIEVPTHDWFHSKKNNEIYTMMMATSKHTHPRVRGCSIPIIH